MKTVKDWIAGSNVKGRNLKGKKWEREYIINLTVTSLLKSGFTRAELKIMRHGKQGGTAETSVKTAMMHHLDKAKVFGKNYFNKKCLLIF